MGLYTVPERVERDGKLVAFEGEIMSEEEARERGILEAPKPAAKKAPAKKAATKKAAE